MSSTPLRALPSPSLGAAESFSPTEPTCCVVQLRHQAPGVIHQVVLDPLKMKDGLIRLGDWPGDEACGWQHLENVVVLTILGTAERVSPTEMRVTPMSAGDCESDHAID